MEIMLKNKNGFQVNISLSIFFIAFCDLFADFPSYFPNIFHYAKYQYLTLSGVGAGVISKVYIVAMVELIVAPGYLKKNGIS
jgi:hypothetical protein